MQSKGSGFLQLISSAKAHHFHPNPGTKKNVGARVRFEKIKSEWIFSDIPVQG